MYKVMPKNNYEVSGFKLFFKLNYSKKAFIEDITSKTSESESSGFTGKLRTYLIKISAFGQLD